MKAEWFGRRLRELREAKGWTQQRLAEAAGLKVSRIGWLEQGRNGPTWASAIALAQALDVSLDAFAREPSDQTRPRPGRPRKAEGVGTGGKATGSKAMGRAKGKRSDRGKARGPTEGKRRYDGIKGQRRCGEIDYFPD